MQRDFQFRMADIENILYEMEGCGQDYFDENGRLYRYSTNPLRRLGSLGMVILALVLATGIVAAACLINKNGSIPAWPLAPTDLPKLLMDLILIIDARFGEIVMKLILGLIGLFGLVIISTKGDDEDY